MKIKSTLLSLLATSAIFAPCYGQETKELLRQALFAEESEGDLKTATKSYESIIKIFEAQRKPAATALYRLAIVKRKQGDDKAAINIYKQLLQQFSDIQPQADLATKDYRALTGKNAPHESKLDLKPFDNEAKKLTELKKLSISHPDRINENTHLEQAVTNGWSKVIHYLLKEKNINPNRDDIILRAVNTGNILITKQLLESGIDLKHKASEYALRLAIEKQYWHMAKLLEEHDAPLLKAENLLLDEDTYNISLDKLKYLVKLGADPNHRLKDAPRGRSTPLTRALYHNENEHVINLLKVKADVNLTGKPGAMFPLHVAVEEQNKKMIQILLKAGADPNAVMIRVPNPGLFNDDFLFENDSNIREPEGPKDLRPIDMAKTDEIRQILIKAGAKVKQEVK